MSGPQPPQPPDSAPKDDALTPPSLEAKPAPKPSDDESPGHLAPELPSPDLVTPSAEDAINNSTEKVVARGIGQDLARAAALHYGDDYEDTHDDAAVFIHSAKDEAGRRRRRYLIGAAFAGTLALVAIGVVAFLLLPPPPRFALGTATPGTSASESPSQTQTSTSTATPLPSAAESVTPGVSLTPAVSMTPATSPVVTLAPGATFGAQASSSDKNALVQFFASDVPAGQQVTVQRMDTLPPVLSLLANAKLPFYDIEPHGIVPKNPAEFAENTDLTPIPGQPGAFELSALALQSSATDTFSWLLNQTLQHPIGDAPVVAHYGQLTTFDAVYTLVDSAVIKSEAAPPQQKQFSIHIELDFTKGMAPQQWPALGTVTPTVGQGFPTFSQPVIGPPTDGQQTLDLAGTCPTTGPLLAAVTFQVVNFGAGDAGLATLNLPPTTLNVFVGFQENC